MSSLLQQSNLAKAAGLEPPHQLLVASPSFFAHLPSSLLMSCFGPPLSPPLLRQRPAFQPSPLNRPCTPAAEILYISYIPSESFSSFTTPCKKPALQRFVPRNGPRWAHNLRNVSLCPLTQASKATFQSCLYSTHVTRAP